MPIGRYFLYIGSVLLALLLVADWYLAPPGAGAAASDAGLTASPDRYSIRIHSARKLPQAVTIDTTLPTIVPPPVTAVAAKAPASRPPREAYAMAIDPVPLPAARPAKASKPAKRHVRRARSVNNRMVSNSDTFGFRDDWFAPRRREASASRHDRFGPQGFWPMSW